MSIDVRSDFMSSEKIDINHNLMTALTALSQIPSEESETHSICPLIYIDNHMISGVGL